MLLPAEVYLTHYNPSIEFDWELIDQCTLLYVALSNGEVSTHENFTVIEANLIRRPGLLCYSKYEVHNEHFQKHSYFGENKTYHETLYSILTPRSYLRLKDQGQYTGSINNWDGRVYTSRIYRDQRIDIDYTGISVKNSLNSLRLFLTTRKTIMSSSKGFIASYLDILPYIDPDSPRFVDWIFGERMKFGLPTHTRHCRLPNDDGIWTIPEVVKTMPDLNDLVPMEEFKGKLTTHVYQSNGFYRVYVVERVRTGNLLFKRYAEVIRLCLVIGRTDSELTFVSVGEQRWVEYLNAFAEHHFKVPASITLSTLIGFGQNGPMIKESVIRQSDKEQYLAHDEFYPFLKEEFPGGLEELVEQYSKDRASSLLLIGPPGTGKSTLLRTLMFMMERKQNSAISNEMVLMEPGALPWIQSQPDNTLLMVEDADNFCKPRKDGNYQMSAFLNHLDGIACNGNKVVISTNLPSLRDVDEALIRPGRTFKVISFRLLTVEEAIVVRQKLKLSPIEHIPDHWYEKGVSLGEVTNYKPGIVVPKTQSIGFRP